MPILASASKGQMGSAEWQTALNWESWPRASITRRISRASPNFGKNSSTVLAILPSFPLQRAKVRHRPDDSWPKSVYGLIMPAENILQPGRLELGIERDTLKDDTAVRFGPDAIEGCLIIPVEILLSHQVVKIHTWIKLLQNSPVAIERPGGSPVPKCKLRRGGARIIINFRIFRQCLDLADHAQLF